MLVLRRKYNESIVIGKGTPYECTITVVDIRGDNVRLGIDAPKNVSVARTEVQRRVDNDK